MKAHREALLRRMTATLERRGSPRAEMAVIALCTGTAGFLASWGLLQFGLERIWFRYLLALFAAYVVFFALVRLWLYLHSRRARSIDFDDLVDPIEGVLEAALSDPPDAGGGLGSGGEFGGGGASATFDGSQEAAVPGRVLSNVRPSAPDLFDADEVVLPLVIVAALAGALLASGWVVYSAPGLLAELLLDGALVGGLYRRLRSGRPEDWLTIALRKTLLPFLVTGALVLFAGWFMQSRLPEAHSLGDVMRHLHDAR